MAAAVAASCLGEKVDSVARAFGVPPSTLDAWRRKAGVMRATRGSPRKLDYALIKRRKADGQSVSSIARDLSTSRTAIMYALGRCT